MTKGKWIMPLSTTEPFNNVGLIKVRSGNKNSEIIMAPLVENNLPIDLTDCDIFFCTAFDPDTLIEKPAVILDAKKGHIQFTMDDDCMQKEGKRDAYFEIRKGEEVLDTTQDFKYTVTWSIFKKLMNGQSYIHRLEEFLNWFADYKESTKEGFDEWFESIKDLLGTDPAGQLALKIGNLSLFRRWDEDIISKMSNEFTEREVNIKWYGALGNANYYNTSNKKWYADQAYTIESNDDTIAIKEALRINNNLVFPQGNYLIKMANLETSGNSLFTIENRKNIRVSGNNACLIDDTSYTQKVLLNIFNFSKSENILIDIDYYAHKIDREQLGYLGATFVNFEKKCKNIKVTSEIINARYGVRSGDYSDFNKGDCSEFDITIRSIGTGYPFAGYLASNINLSIDAIDVHRALYMAGCTNVVGDVYVEGFVFANAVVLATNSILTSSSVPQNEQIARGCKDLNINVYDKGCYTVNSSLTLTSIALQWVCRTDFRNIHFHIVSKTNNERRVISAFLLMSKVNDSEIQYPFNWTKDVSIIGIEVSGKIDRSEQTLANSNFGDVYINCHDPNDTAFEHIPKIESINFSNLELVSTNPMQTNNIIIPKSEVTISFKNVLAENSQFSINTPDGKVLVESSKIKTLGSSNTISELKKVNSLLPDLAINKIGNFVNLDKDLTKMGENGFDAFPSGVKIQWKKVYYDVAANVDMIVPLQNAFALACVNAQITPFGYADIRTSVTGITKNSVTINCSTTKVTVYLVAIGY